MRLTFAPLKAIRNNELLLEAAHLSTFQVVSSSLLFSALELRAHHVHLSSSFPDYAAFPADVQLLVLHSQGLLGRD